MRRGCRTTRRRSRARLTGALFAAGDVLSWLAAGAQSVDWWDMNNYSGTSAEGVTKPDYGMFSSSSPPVAQTPYYGYLLASMLAQPNAVLATMGTSDPADVLAYQSRLPGGREAPGLPQHQHQLGQDGDLQSRHPAVRPAADLDLQRGKPEPGQPDPRPGHARRRVLSRQGGASACRQGRWSSSSPADLCRTRRSHSPVTPSAAPAGRESGRDDEDTETGRPIPKSDGP